MNESVCIIYIIIDVSNNVHTMNIEKRNCMCTAIALNNKGLLFGRTMDISYSFNEQVVITPRNYQLTLKEEVNLIEHYAIIGMACVIEDYPLYADAMNEEGLCMAGLNFKGYAYYETKVMPDKKNITPYEFIPYILGQCASVSEAITRVRDISLISIPFQEGLDVSPLHWMLSDEVKSVVIEYGEKGLEIFDNPIGVMCNNPGFDYHLLNLNNYLKLSVHEPKNTCLKECSLISLGHGAGALGLPGDTSSPSRFVRAAFVKSNAVLEEKHRLSQFFHILDSVKVVKGVAFNEKLEADYTTYSSCMDTKSGVYYYNTYYSNQLVGVRLHDTVLEGNELVVHSLIVENEIQII